MMLTIPLERPPMTANDQRRAHWAKVSAAKKLIQGHVITQVRATGLGKQEAPVDVWVTWFAPDRRKRDSDALGPCLKAVLDGLRMAGVLVDDCPPHVRWSGHRVVPRPGNPCIEVALIPAVSDHYPHA